MLNYNNETLYAGFFVRLSAFIIDSIIVGLALLVIKIPKFFMSLINPDIILLKPLIFKFSFMDIILYLLSLTYFVLMTYFFGATLGKKLLKLKVCKLNGEKLSFIDVLYRESIGRYLSALIIGIGYIMIAVDSRKRALHDILCDTFVIYDFGHKQVKQQITSVNQHYVEIKPEMQSQNLDKKTDLPESNNENN